VSAYRCYCIDFEVDGKNSKAAAPKAAAPLRASRCAVVSTTSLLLLTGVRAPWKDAQITGDNLESYLFDQVSHRPTGRPVTTVPSTSGSRAAFQPNQLFVCALSLPLKLVEWEGFVRRYLVPFESGVMALGMLTLGLALLIVSSRHYCDGQKTGYALRSTFALLTLLLGMLVGNFGGSSLPLPLPATALLSPRHTYVSRAEGRHQLVVTTVNLISQGSRVWPTQPQFSSSSFSWRSGYADCA
jgi:hypothetical protein